MSGVSLFWFIKISVLIVGLNTRRAKRAVSLVAKLNADTSTVWLIRMNITTRRAGVGRSGNTCATAIMA